MAGKLFFRGYYIPKSYSDKIIKYNTTIKNYTDSQSANQSIINLNINTTENESTR